MNSLGGDIQNSSLAPYIATFYYVLHSPIVCGSLAGSGACLVSTPSEVVKTRLQLQGELGVGGQNAYKGFFHGVFTILKHEGLAGIYSGIAPAIYYQVVMNGARFGCHKTFKDILCSISGSDKPTYVQNVGASGFAGVVGAVIASPFYLVKVRLQASTKSQGLAVGYQYNYRSTVDGLRTIVHREGIKGLWRGAEGQVLRVGLGSAVQISTYEQIRGEIEKTPFFIKHAAFLPAAAALCTSVPLVIAMNPVDVVATRLYNQKVVNGHGTLYSGPFDCLWKTFKQEGFLGWYKGTSAHYMRLAPHTLSTFVLFEFFQGLGKRKNNIVSK